MPPNFPKLLFAHFLFLCMFNGLVHEKYLYDFSVADVVPRERLTINHIVQVLVLISAA